jgi:hypothetical protein
MIVWFNMKYVLQLKNDVRFPPQSMSALLDMKTLLLTNWFGLIWKLGLCTISLILDSTLSCTKLLLTNLAAGLLF